MNVNLSMPAQGVNIAIQQHVKSAEKIARFNQDQKEFDLAHEIVQQMEAKNMVTANTSVVKSIDEMIGNIIDIVG